MAVCMHTNTAISKLKTCKRQNVVCFSCYKFENPLKSSLSLYIPLRTSANWEEEGETNLALMLCFQRRRRKHSALRILRNARGEETAVCAICACYHIYSDINHVHKP